MKAINEKAMNNPSENLKPKDLNPENEPVILEAKVNRPLGRRRFIGKAAVLALGSVASLNWLAACGESPTATAVSTTLAPTTVAPTSASTLAPSATPALPTATSVPPSATAAPTATLKPTVAPTATALPVFQPLQFGVLGDIRTAGPKPPQVAYDMIDKLKAQKPEVVVLVGDIINAETTAVAVRQQWNNVNTAIANLAPAAILPTVGNHETNGLKSVLPYFNEAFPALPTNGPEGYKGLTYSYDAGSVHFVSITSEHPNRFHQLTQVQLDWLAQDLANNKKPFTFVFSHDPAFPVGPHVGSSLDAYPQERDALWKTMQRFKVTAYICGHEHLYNRSQKGGLTQLIIGTSGSAIYGGYGGEFYHYGVFNVTEQGVAVKIYDTLGKIRDTFTLV